MELEKFGALRQQEKSPVPPGAIFEFPFHGVEVVAFECRLHDAADLLVIPSHPQFSERASDRHVVDENLRLFHGPHSHAAQHTKLDVPEMLDTDPNTASNHDQDQAERSAAR